MIRKGMWIEVDGRCAIAARILFVEVPDGDGGTARVPSEVEAHYVTDEGTTATIALVPVDACKPAPLALIPAARRPAPAQAALFGCE